MNEKKFKVKLLEYMAELGKPKKYEVGFVQGNRVINDGLNILGLTSIDILGFTKSANDNRIRKSRGAQAWFKKMYEDGWEYVASFEQEGLLTNGFIVMKKELPNKILDIIKEELDIMLRDDEGEKYKHIPSPEILRGTPQIREINPDKLQTVTFEKRGDLEKAIKKAREPKEGFTSEVNDFIIDSQKEPKTYEEIFFEETGNNAVWRGKNTIAFKKWLEDLD